MSFVKNLEVRISLTKNDAVLYTQRFEESDLITFLSNLAGSILGLLGLIGFIMNNIEENYESFVKKRNQRQAYKEFLRSSSEFLSKNFDDYSENIARHSNQEASRNLLLDHNLSLTAEIDSDASHSTRNRFMIIKVPV
jgi:hypothetical protein